MGWKHLTVGKSSIGGLVCSVVFLPAWDSFWYLPDVP
mgnify:FL=1